MYYNSVHCKTPPTKSRLIGVPYKRGDLSTGSGSILVFSCVIFAMICMRVLIGGVTLYQVIFAGILVQHDDFPVFALVTI